MLTEKEAMQLLYPPMDFFPFLLEVLCLNLLTALLLFKRQPILFQNPCRTFLYLFNHRNHMPPVPILLSRLSRQQKDAWLLLNNTWFCYQHQDATRLSNTFSSCNVPTNTAHAPNIQHFLINISLLRSCYALPANYLIVSLSTIESSIQGPSVIFYTPF